MDAPGRAAPTTSQPAILRRDLLLVSCLPLLVPFAWLTSARTHDALSRVLSAIAPRIRPAVARRNEQRLCAAFDIVDKAAFCDRVRIHAYCELLQILSLHAPGRQVPPVRLEGAEILTEALGRGRGIILWVAPTIFGPTLTKVALKASGVSLSHLSRPTHGFSPSAFGQTFLNPLRTRIEDRYLARRIVIEGGQTRRALEELTRCLERNQAISITMGVEARTVNTIPFLSGTMTLACRPVRLARETGAALLPVVTLREDEGGYLTRIGPHLLDSDATDDEAFATLAAFLEPCAQAFPEQFAHSPVFWPRDVSEASPTVPAASPSRSRPSPVPSRSGTEWR